MNSFINRRAALRNLVIIAGGAMILPACYRKSGKASIELNNLQITEDEESLLETLADTLIPKTDTPGAKELKLHLFVLKMVDDCYKPEDQDQFTKGLRALPSFAKSTIGKDFVNASAKERGQLLLKIQDIKDTEEATEKGQEAGDDKSLKRFYDITKSKTIQGYLNSKYVMTNLVKYELVPGRYNGYFPA
ncbi:Gluconate 2-dehydrogenase subunit 3 [bacterium A37T11]|nr:Gluconate 2-dehydrogenase subunit 3 [bacterium A37T11]